MWQLLTELRGERRTGRSARMLFEVLGDIWVVERNPYLQDDLLDNPKRQRLLVDAMRHRVREIEKRRARRERRATRSATPRSRGSSPAAHAAVDRFAASFRDTADLRKRTRRVAVALHRQGQHRVRRPRARVARDRRDRLARRVSVRRAVSRTPRTKCAASSKAASSSASRSFRAAAAPATRAARFRSTRARRSSTPRSSSASSAVEPIVLPGHADADADDRLRRRRRHASA